MSSETTFATVTGSPAMGQPSRTSPSTQLAQPPEPTATTTATSLTLDFAGSVGARRGDAKIHHEDLGERHRDSLIQAWDKRTQDHAKLAPLTLLADIAALGFAWRDIARMVGVSVPAVQKWRRSGGVTGANRRELAAILALCEEIRDRFMVQEIASWFEVPLSRGAPLTPVDLYAGGRAELVLEYASEQSEPEQVLSSFDPKWRERYRTEFEVFLDAEGGHSIRHKEA